MPWTDYPWVDEPNQDTPVLASVLKSEFRRLASGIPYEDVRWHGAACDDSTDDTAAIQATDAALAAAGGGTLYIPALCRVTGPLTYSPGVNWVGASRVMAGLRWTVDLGAGVYGLAPSASAGTYNNNTIRDLYLSGPASSTTLTPGSAAVSMDGLKINRRTVFGFSRIRGFKRGAALGADHASIVHSEINNNHDNLSFVSAPSRGDHLILDTDLNGASMSSICVEDGTFIDGSNFSSVHLGNCPHGIRSTAGRVTPQFVVNSVFHDVAIENFGNTAILAGTDTDVWANNYWGGAGGVIQDPTYLIPATTFTYLMDMGEIADFVIDNPAFITADPGRIRSRANSLQGVQMRQLSGSALNATGSGSPLLVCSDGSASLLCSWRSSEASGYFARTNAALTKGQLLRVVGRDNVGIWTSAGDIPAGFAKHAAASGEIVAIGAGGYLGTLPIAGAAIAARKFLKPDPVTPGRVLEATDFSDGPIVGVSYTAAAGAASTFLAEGRCGTWGT